MSGSLFWWEFQCPLPCSPQTIKYQSFCESLISVCVCYPQVQAYEENTHCSNDLHNLPSILSDFESGAAAFKASALEEMLFCCSTRSSTIWFPLTRPGSESYGRLEPDVPQVSPLSPLTFVTSGTSAGWGGRGTCQKQVPVVGGPHWAWVQVQEDTKRLAGTLQEKHVGVQASSPWWVSFELAPPPKLRNLLTF